MSTGALAGPPTGRCQAQPALVGSPTSRGVATLAGRLVPEAGSLRGRWSAACASRRGGALPGPGRGVAGPGTGHGRPGLWFFGTGGERKGDRVLMRFDARARVQGTAQPCPPHLTTTPSSPASLDALAVLVHGAAPEVRAEGAAGRGPPLVVDPLVGGRGAAVGRGRLAHRHSGAWARSVSRSSAPQRYGNRFEGLEGLKSVASKACTSEGGSFHLGGGGKLAV